MTIHLRPMISALRRTDDQCESCIGLPHSRTLRRKLRSGRRASVLESGSPMPLFCTLWFALVVIACGQNTNSVHEIDLPTTLRLAGAQNLDVQIARERLAEA